MNLYKVEAEKFMGLLSSLYESFILIFMFSSTLISLVMTAGVYFVRYKQINISKKLGVPESTAKFIATRWLMHVFGIREDDVAVKLFSVLPNTSIVGWWMTFFPLIFYYKITGKQNRFFNYKTERKDGFEGPRNHEINRTIYVDNIIDFAKVEAKQLVVINAGMDTRPYKDLKNSELRIFEVDREIIQQFKIKYLYKAGFNTSHVTYVKANFLRDNWLNSLVEAGFDLNERAIFLLEGVTEQLSENMVRRIFRIIKANAKIGSSIITEIYSQRYISGTLTESMSAKKPVLDETNEELAFGIEMKGDYENALKTFAESEGFSVGEAYYMGRKTTEYGTWMIVAELII